jgi:hypothetical protein
VSIAEPQLTSVPDEVPVENNAHIHAPANRNDPRLFQAARSENPYALRYAHETSGDPEKAASPH